MRAAGEHLRMHGLTVRSEVALHHARAPDGPVDLDVQLGADRASSDELPAGTVLARIERPEGGPFYTLVARESGYLLRCHGSCDIEIDGDLATAVCHVDPDGVPQILPVIIAGTLLSMVLCLRGELVLHASAVEMDGRAIAFAGESGMAKSTMANWLCGAGAGLITDDVLRVEPGSPTVCWLGATASRPRPAASSLAADFGADATRAPPDERMALSVPLAMTDPLALRAVLIPQPDRAATAPSIRWLASADAMIVLSRFSRVLGWESPRVLGEQFAALGRLVRAVPVGIATVPWGPPFDPEVPGLLIATLDSADRRLR